MDLPFVEDQQPASAASLAGWRPGDAWLAGGTWLFSEPQPELRRLLDLRAFGWSPLTVSDDAGLEIAATCTLRELAELETPTAWPAARVIRSCCESLLGSFKIWNEATVGGNICLSLPAGPMTSLAASLDGICEIWHADGSVEQLPAVDFVTGNRSNALRPGSLLRCVRLPARALRARAAFRQASRTRHGRSAALVIGIREPGSAATTVTVTAAVTRPLQLRFTEPPSAAELRRSLAAADAGYFDDAHGSAAWRRQLASLLAEQVRQELEAQPRTHEQDGAR